MADKPLHEMTPEESHRAGVSPIIALEARIKNAKRQCEIAKEFYGLTAWGLACVRLTTLEEALALLQPGATISERANQR